MLDQLEELLAITEQFKTQMDNDTLRAWHRISAETADAREQAQRHPDQDAACEVCGLPAEYHPILCLCPTHQKEIEETAATIAKDHAYNVSNRAEVFSKIVRALHT